MVSLFTLPTDSSIPFYGDISSINKVSFCLYCWTQIFVESVRRFESGEDQR